MRDPDPIRVLLTLSEDALEDVLKLVLHPGQLLLMSLLLLQQTADVGVGTLDHAVEVVDVTPVHVPALQPRRQNHRRLHKVFISWGR